MAKTGMIFVLMSLLCVQVIWSADDLDYSRLVSYLKGMTDPDIIPLTETNNPVQVSVTLSLVKLLDVDKEWNEVEALVWQTIQWRDPALSWEMKDFGTNISTINLPVENIWTPDLTLYNSVKSPEVTSPMLAVVSRDGSVLMVPSVRMRFSCDLQELDSPSGVNCTLKIGSWTYNGHILTLADGPSFSTDEYVISPRYSLVGTHAEKNTAYYPCCPEPYEDYQFTLTIKEKNSGFFSSLL